MLRESIIIMIVAVSLGVYIVKSCPLLCTCKWKGGKRKVECTNKNLTSVISNIDQETQVLDYSRNNLHVLKEHVFEHHSLLNLQKLYLSNCQISYIDDTALQGLANLIELDLGNNILTTVPAANLKSLPLLMKISLAFNPIKFVKSFDFSNLKYLATVDLSNCQIETVEIDAFDGVAKLEWLKLEGNKLQNLKHAESMPPVTSGFSLHQNPWKCDCHLRSFYNWLTKLDGTTPVPILVHPVCDEPPNYHGLMIHQLGIKDLACAPSVIPSSLFVEINEGKNISFVCQVSAVPEAHITWDFEGNAVSDNTSIIYPFYKYYAEEATTEQVSELFVYEAKKENNGTYHCTAENIAGKSTSNYTLKVTNMPKPSSTTKQEQTVHNIQILVTSLSFLLAMTVVAVFFICCTLYAYRRKANMMLESQEKVTLKNNTVRVKYEIIKQQDDKEASTQPSTKTEKGLSPDLIINTQAQSLDHCEHLILMPNDIEQTCVVMRRDVRGEELENNINIPNEPQEGTSQINLLSPNVASETNELGIINVYLSPGNCNMYINPFHNPDINPVKTNCWTVCMSKDNGITSLCNNEHNKLLSTTLECYQKAAKYYHLESAILDSMDGTSSNAAKLRPNLEGYPYPSTLEIPVRDSNLESTDMTIPLSETPILSPPDPFKSGTTY